MNFLRMETTEEDDLPNKQITGIRSTCKTIRSIILRRHGVGAAAPAQTAAETEMRQAL